MITRILQKVKQHKKYRKIADEIVIDEIKRYLKSNPNVTHIDQKLIKDIRKELHLSYASFQTRKKGRRYEYLKEMEKELDDKISRKLLGLTLSTKERLEDYKKIYSRIFKITGKPSVIVDLGCGLNPVSYPYMKLAKVNYYAYDIDEDDMDFLNDYFKIMKIQGLIGKARILNLKNKHKVSRLPRADIIFLLKVIDILDREHHKISEELIKKLVLKAKFIVVSFATHTLTRRRMHHPKRKWFELMLDRNGLKFKMFKTSNEVFYVVWRN